MPLTNINYDNKLFYTSIFRYTLIIDTYLPICSYDLSYMHANFYLHVINVFIFIYH